MDVLERRLEDAMIHFELFMGIRKNSLKCQHDISSTPVFWQYTMKAHSDTALLHLCRIYDVNSSSIQMSRFLENVQSHQNLFSEPAFRERHKKNINIEILVKHQRYIDCKQLQKDIQFCGEENPNIQTLRLWRNNVIAHSNYRESISSAKPFHQKYPLSFKAFETLIEEGCNIINRYSSLLNAATYSLGYARRQAGEASTVLQSQRYERVMKERQWRKTLPQKNRLG